MQVVSFTENLLDQAAELVIINCKYERKFSPLLPIRDIDEIRKALQPMIDNPGVAIVKAGTLQAFMVTGHRFPWKGQRAVIVPEFCHAARPDDLDRNQLYQLLYMNLAQKWVDGGNSLHVIGHLAHDELLKKTVFQLGFGAILAEHLRDCSDITVRNDLLIEQTDDINRLVDIQLEHNSYYPHSPIFITKPTDRKKLISDLQEHFDRGDVFFTYSEGNTVKGYMIAGESAEDAEGFLLQNTNTAQVKSAFIMPDIRGKGIGTALLQRSIQWFRDRGYDRIFVEHETANYYGGNFWQKHFSPYLYFSMRYVDNTVGGK